jgi:hypothetical protein
MVVPSIKKIIFFLSIAFLALVFSSGCRKKKDTLATIYVKDFSNAYVSGAKVVLYGKSTTNSPANVILYDTAYTDSTGLATFNYNNSYQLGQAGVAVLDISASKNGKIGTGIIKVQQETTSTETVYIQ